jgi:hypothetical protein
MGAYETFKEVDDKMTEELLFKMKAFAEEHGSMMNSCNRSCYRHILKAGA